jgi:hypothetical protein
MGYGARAAPRGGVARGAGGALCGRIRAIWRFVSSKKWLGCFSFFWAADLVNWEQMSMSEMAMRDY